MNTPDSIYIDVTCPYCNKTRLRQVITKDLGSKGLTYKLGTLLNNCTIQDLVLTKKDPSFIKGYTYCFCKTKNKIVKKNLIVKILITYSNRIGKILDIKKGVDSNVI